MISVRECLDRPQVLSTDRHVMQGYLDLKEVEWDGGNRVLSGVSKVVGGDPYRVSLALNGNFPIRATCGDKETSVRLSAPQGEIVELILERPENETVEWSVSFKPE